eukprot:Clim_evm106s210 gene=Clim_evmTU106s210
MPPADDTWVRRLPVMPKGRKSTAEELADERAKTTFPVREMSYLLDGGKKETERKEFLESLLIKDPLINSKETHQDVYYKTHAELAGLAARKTVRLEQIRRENNLSYEDSILLRRLNPDGVPTDLQHIMFIPNIEELFDEEQQSWWLQKAYDYEILGCYAQTELGHGSNVRGLETTATYIPETEEWEFNTPSLTAAKWWPGALGRSATHAVVYARLILRGKDYGVHNFMVQIRRLDNQELMPGVYSGDIGPKIGYNTQENGYLLFNKVRAPRRALAGKYQTVTAEGVYKKNPDAHSKISYVSMMYVRSMIIYGASKNLAQAVTIAARYLAQRRQGFAPGSTTEEVKILDYPIQQYRVLTQLASAYAYHFSGDAMLLRYEKGMEEVRNGDFSGMADMHNVSSGLKSLVTRLTADGIEDMRKACGGSGYLKTSGLPDLVGTYQQNCTVEGDNYMLTGQVSRYLIKCLMASQKGHRPNGAAEYIADLPKLLPLKSKASRPEDITADLDSAIVFFQHRAAYILSRVAAKMQRLAKQGKNEEQIRQDVTVEFFKLSNAHIMSVLVANFVNGLKTVQNKQLVPVLTQLCELFVAYQFEQNVGDFVASGFFTPDQAEMAAERVVQLLPVVRPNAIGLSDAFGISDFRLNSAIGQYAGNCYEGLYEYARREPLNHEEPCRESHAIINVRAVNGQFKAAQGARAKL